MAQASGHNFALNPVKCGGPGRPSANPPVEATCQIAVASKRTASFRSDAAGARSSAHSTTHRRSHAAQHATKNWGPGGAESTITLPCGSSAVVSISEVCRHASRKDPARSGWLCARKSSRVGAARSSSRKAGIRVCMLPMSWDALEQP